MERTHLIQRLKKPRGSAIAFSFGGGLPAGGFSKEAQELLKNVCTFDYMGSAEFEFGEVPRAFYRIAEYSSNREASSGELCFPDEVYYICEKGIEREVKGVIAQLVRNEEELRLKEPCYLWESITGEPEWASDYVGWVELDNAFMFFTDREMFNKFQNLFSINSSQSQKTNREEA